MNKIDYYRTRLGTLENWDDYLLQESGLPGPRANIELARAVAAEGQEELFKRLIMYNAEIAPTNSPEEFLAFCGTLGLGRLLAGQRHDVLPQLRLAASDPRWRIREAVAMALQRFGEKNFPTLISEMEVWGNGNYLEKRAAAAAFCEPRLLKEEQSVKKVLDILDKITESFLHTAHEKSDQFKALRKGMGYCWSVAVSAFPEEGKKRMERWFNTENANILWVMKENLKKKRLERMDADWVNFWKDKFLSK